MLLENKMRTTETGCISWIRNILENEEEQSIVVSPWDHGGRQEPDPVRLANVMLGASKTFLQVARSTSSAVKEADKLKAQKSIPVFFLLCHSNATLSRFDKTGLPGKYGTEERFKNEFLKSYRSIADLSTCVFGEDDSNLVCMTYGQCAKILGQIHVNLVMRASKGEHLERAKITMATHIIMLDAWYSSADLFATFHTYDAIASYGCAVPRIEHITQSLRIATSSALNPAVVPSATARSASIVTLRYGAHTLSQSTTALAKDKMEKTLVKLSEAVMSAIAEKRSSEGGCTYIIVPDRRIENEIRKRYRHTFSREGWDFKEKSEFEENSNHPISFVQIDSIYDCNFSKLDHMFILPIQRRTVKDSEIYVYCNDRTIGALIGMIGSTIKMIHDGSRVPVDIYVVGPDYSAETPPETVDVSAFLQQRVVSPRELAREHIKNAGYSTKLRQLCVLAGASVQPGDAFMDIMDLAAERDLIRFTLHNWVYNVTHIRPMGMMMMRVGTSPQVSEFIKKWQDVPYHSFPGFCTAALLERYVDHKAPLVSGTVETLAEIAKTNAFKDPFVHQMTVVVEYIRQFGIVVADISQTRLMCEPYGADASILHSIILRICAMRSGLGADSKYGPFDPEELVAIFDEYNIFPTLGSSPDTNSARKYARDNDPKDYSISADTPYSLPTTLMLMYCSPEEQSSWFTNKRYSLDLYAVI